MSESFFPDVPPIRYEGPASDAPLAYRWYDRDEVLLGRRMEDHLRIAVCWWHTFCNRGGDMFGADAFERAWFGDDLASAERKVDAAFELFSKLGVPFFTFHDRDVAPEGASLRETAAHLETILGRIEQRMRETGLRLLWGTANLFGHPRYAAGAATNPDPEVFAFAAAQVRTAMDATRRLGGSNYVLWGGREGYDTLLNTDLRREAEQLGRFLSMVVEHKHRSGFTGTLLVEPKPMEPTKHQYDRDAATVHAFLRRFGLEREIRLNVEVNHATLAGHDFEHEVAYAIANDLLGSLDVNRGDPRNGWDTDQFPNSTDELSLVLWRILRAGGFTTGGCNFDAKLRRQSLDAVDLFHAHVGGIDTLARALRKAVKLVEDGRLEGELACRYAGWDSPLGRGILAGEHTLDGLARLAEERGLDPKPRSGGQERLENLVNRIG